MAILFRPQFINTWHLRYPWSRSLCSYSRFCIPITISKFNYKTSMLFILKCLLCDRNTSSQIRPIILLGRYCIKISPLLSSLYIFVTEDSGATITCWILSIWSSYQFSVIWHFIPFPDSKFHGANMGPTWSGVDRTQVSPILAPWTLLSGLVLMCCL